MIFLLVLTSIYALMHFAAKKAVDSYDGCYGADKDLFFYENTLPRTVLGRLDNVVK